MQLRRWIIPVHLRKRKTAVHQRQAGMGDVFSFHAIVILGIEPLQPDMREGSEEVDESTDNVVVDFWKRMMEQYGNADDYEDTIKNRFDRLLAVVKESGTDRSHELQGKTLPVLVEGVNDHDETLLTGRLTNNMLVHFPGSAELIGTIVDVEITESKGFYFFGFMTKKD